MSQEKLDQNIVYFTCGSPKKYWKTNIYNFPIDLFTKILQLGPNKGIIEDKFVLKKKIYQHYDITRIVSVYHFCQLKDDNVIIGFENFILFNEKELLDLIRLFETLMGGDSNIELDSLKQNYKKYLNEATIKSIIE